MRSLAILRLSVLSPIFWATFILSFTYGLNARFGTAGGAFWDVVLRVHLSSTIFALVVLPLWMALAVFITRPLREEGALIRYGSFQSAWWWGARQLSARWLGLAVARIFGLYVSAVGLPLASTVIDPGVVGSVTAHGLNPVWVLGGQIVLETAFALTIALVLNTLTVLGASIYVQVITAMAFFGWFLAGASGALSVDSIFNLARFVQVQFLLTDPRTALLVLVASLGIVVALSLLARAKDMAIRLSSASPWANAITIHWLLGALLLAVLISQNLDTALEENLITVMSGNAGSTMNALTWSFIYCGLCGAWVVSRMPNSRQLLSLELLRAGSARAWMLGVLRRDVQAICFFGATICVPSVVLYYGLGGVGIDSPTYAALVTWVLLVNTSLHACLVMGAAVLGLFLSHSSNGALGGVVVSFLLALIPQAPTTWWPFGAANLARVEFGASAVLQGSISIIIATVLVWSAAGAISMLHWTVKQRETSWVK